MIKKIEEKMQESRKSRIEYMASKPSFGVHLTRNLALAGMLLLAITSVRNAALPSGKTILASVQDIIETDWDSDIGKISFVSNLFPETVSVFFDSSPDALLTQPCFGELIHPWDQNEPYLGYESADSKVYAVAAGQVMSIAHGNNEEKILRIRQADGLETLYYNLASISVQEGDYVTSSTFLGQVLPAAQAVIEVRKDGLAIDPTGMMEYRGDRAL